MAKVEFFVSLSTEHGSAVYLERMCNLSEWPVIGDYLGFGELGTARVRERRVDCHRNMCVAIVETQSITDVAMNETIASWTNEGFVVRHWYIRTGDPIVSALKQARTIFPVNTDNADNADAI